MVNLKRANIDTKAVKKHLKDIFKNFNISVRKDDGWVNVEIETNMPSLHKHDDRGLLTEESYRAGEDLKRRVEGEILKGRDSGLYEFYTWADEDGSKKDKLSVEIN